MRHALQQTFDPARVSSFVCTHAQRGWGVSKIQRLLEQMRITHSPPTLKSQRSVGPLCGPWARESRVAHQTARAVAGGRELGCRVSSVETCRAPHDGLRVCAEHVSGPL